MEENKKPVVALTNSERFPLLSDLSYLNKLKQDQFAPKFNFQSGDRLFRHHLQQVQAYAEKLNSKPPVNEGASPGWLDHYLQWCIETVPFYKNRKSHFEEQPTIGRGDLHRAPWKFVSADCDLEDMLVYQTSGTTGSAMDVVFDPVSQACWIPQLESVLDSYGIKLSRGPYVTAIALICDQQSTLTYPSLSSYLEGAGILKINLNVSDWNDAGHRLKYLEKYNPEVLTGDPFAFLSLLALTPRLSPKALVSSAMKMTQGIKEKLEAYFKCPVLDIYSLTECRMIAVAEDKRRHRAIRPELYLEVFHPDKDVLLKDGQRGELVITGGNNPFLPLIRYRTGDFCSLMTTDNRVYLVDLEGRLPVAFYRADNSFVNTIDISRELTQYPLAGFELHQEADKQLIFTGWSNEVGLDVKISSTLQKIFGQDINVRVTIRQRETIGVKPVAFSSDYRLNNEF